CNSVLGARTNTEGRESTSAAMLTGKIPDFGLHRDENRFGTHLIQVEVDVDNIMDWGMLGYYAGDRIQEHVPVLSGKIGNTDLLRHKHFGAAAASSGGVELYHMVGITPEADTLEAAFGPRRPDEVLQYGPDERRQTWETLNANGRSTEVDFVMLGCPHYTLEQIEEVIAMLGSRRISGNCRLWIFTSRAVRSIADGKGYTEAIRRAGGVLLTDTCSAIGQTIPPGTRVAALDSAKQTHYLPAFMGIEAWFGSTRDCINAALSGRWSAAPP
ncbi:MAG TPA: aconitase X, partial [Gammaproteobacteria bacterium]|nr:aconitase X [Gammaproteobacteria bacterium]